MVSEYSIKARAHLTDDLNIYYLFHCTTQNFVIIMKEMIGACQGLLAKQINMISKKILLIVD